MDFTFTEEQQAAVEAAKAVFGAVAPDSVPSPALTPGAVADDFDRALWSKLADADLLSLLLAPEHGGADLDAIALCLVLRESAKALARVPLLEHTATAVAVQTYGPAELKEQILPGQPAANSSSPPPPQAEPATTRPNSPSAHAATRTPASGSSTAPRPACPGRTTPTTSPYPPTLHRAAPSSP